MFWNFANKLYLCVSILTRLQKNIFWRGLEFKLELGFKLSWNIFF